MFLWTKRLRFASVDISGRPYLVFDADFPQERCGGYDCSMTVEFMRAFAFNAQITLHLKSVYGDNSHHITEAFVQGLRTRTPSCRKAKILQMYFFLLKECYNDYFTRY